jgi:dihydrofolate synthase / folylpolyglutamate synthase
MPPSLAPTLSVDDWLDYISHLHPREMDLGLDRIQSVVAPLGWHRFSCPVITVGGTNGKGSCVRFLESILTAAGYRVGAYTSPHLMRFHERIRVHQADVTDAALLTAFAAVEENRRTVSLSFFEFTFLAALHIFQEAVLDVVILEVGLGGRLDAVNVVDADIALITTIDLDHTDWLGPDRESIAREKAGIFRRGQAVICGDPDPPIPLRQRAAELNARWHALGETFQFSGDTAAWSWQSGDRRYTHLPALSLKHQNAAASLMAIELLQNRLPVTEEQLKTGLAQARLAGRFERQGICYLDVAHNPQGGRWLAQQWQQTPVAGKRIAVLGMLHDKDIAGTTHSLLHYVDSWYVASLAVPRGASAEQLRATLVEQGVPSGQVFSFQTVEQALQAALNDADLVSDLVLVFGSFYTIAAARRQLTQEKQNERNE